MTNSPYRVEEDGAGCAHDGAFYAFGDSTGRVQRYDPASNSWSIASTMADYPRHVAVVSLGSLIYVVGGSSCPSGCKTAFAYDPGSGTPTSATWTRLAELNFGRMYAGIAALSGFIYVNGYNQAHFERYDRSTDAWSLVAPNLQARGSPELVAINGYLYTMSAPVSGDRFSVERYDPNAGGINGTWSFVTSLNYARGMYGAAVL